ncbi:MAG: FIST C-terminal domain-containing protein [Syntrophales bacterium]|nr:FIST C-terminal domain-containing protein [Syntrophales bacterium]
MIIRQHLWTKNLGWQPPLAFKDGGVEQLVLVFGHPHILADGALLEDIARAYPQALLCGASTAGEIVGTQVHDQTVTATAIYWEKTPVRTVAEKISSAADSATAGRRMGERLNSPQLKHVMVFCDGLHINGSELVRGLCGALSPQVTITGGLAGAGDRFGETFVIGVQRPQPMMATALGFYGEAIRIGYGSVGGWDPFGPERLVTRARGNVLYELDNRSALDLYKLYLGQYAERLPAAGLLFPLSLRGNQGHAPVVRTLLAVHEADGSMVFAGDIPEGAYVRLMKANFDRLIEGAAQAAQHSRKTLAPHEAQLAVLISCVGRKLVLAQRTEEEVEAVRSVLGARAVYTGFYSYGEIAPMEGTTRCELHNQTMTITAFSEVTSHA